MQKTERKRSIFYRGPLSTRIRGGVRRGTPRASPFRIEPLMTQQPSLFPQESPATNQAPNTDQPLGARRGQSSRQTPLWLLYLELSVRVVVCICVGLVLTVLPWTPFWASNPLLLHSPHIAYVAVNGITRGIVSGIGLLDIWIGISDAIHYKEAESK